MAAAIAELWPDSQFTSGLTGGDVFYCYGKDREVFDTEECPASMCSHVLSQGEQMVRYRDSDLYQTLHFKSYSRY